jgi:hypothetical protein
MKNSKLVLIFICIVLLIFIVGIAYRKTLNTITPWDNYLSKQTTALTVLETQDFSTEPQRFRLNVQSHGSVSQVPQKLILVEKGTDVVFKELLLSESMYPNECASHSDSEMMGADTMKKWDTDWFSITGVDLSDKTYTPKVSEKYDIKIIYNDETAHDIVSTNPIESVCYQISQSTRITPNPKEVLPEE